jgi:hypothetical protein
MKSRNERKYEAQRFFSHFPETKTHTILSYQLHSRNSDVFAYFIGIQTTARDTFVSSHYDMSRDSSVGIALGHGLKDRVLRFDSRWALGIFLFTTASRMALGLTNLPIHGYQGLFPSG